MWMIPLLPGSWRGAAVVATGYEEQGTTPMVSGRSEGWMIPPRDHGLTRFIGPGSQLRLTSIPDKVCRMLPTATVAPGAERGGGGNPSPENHPTHAPRPKPHPPQHLKARVAYARA